MDWKTEPVLTLTSIRSVLPFATLLVAIVLAWTSLTSQIALLNERGLTTNDRLINAEKKLDSLDEKQEDMTRELTRMATIIETAQVTGQLGTSKIRLSATVKQTATQSAVPTRSEAIVVNSSQNQQVESQPQEAKEPEQPQEPEPTPQPQQRPVSTFVGELFNIL